MTGTGQLIDDSGISRDEIIRQLRLLVVAGDRAERAGAEAAAALRRLADSRRRDTDR